MSEKKLLTVDNLTVNYRSNEAVQAVLRQLCLSIKNSEVVGLAGPSGSGKTTLVLCLLGLLPPSAEILSGKIVFEGRELDPREQRAFRAIRGKKISVVFQDPGAVLNPVMRIDRQLFEGMRFHLRLTRKEARLRALQVLEEVGISDPENCLASYPHQLSGGMQQRVLIASATTCQPKLLICDEPTSALDVLVQNKVLGLLRRLRAKHDFSILLISHNLNVINTVSDRLLYLKDGKFLSGHREMETANL
jgi:ABC-type glutathione transport system ATPase component